MIKKIFYILIVFSICKLQAIDKSEQSIIQDHYIRFETAVRIIDSQIKMVDTESACPFSDSVHYVDETLKPITTYLTTFGKRTDPVVDVFMTALDQFKLCLNAYYNLGHLSNSPYVQLLSPDLQVEFKKTFRGIMKNNVSNTGLCFKMYLQMVLYETSENYAEFFPINVLKNHEMFMKQATDTLHNFYLTQFLSSLRLEQDPAQHEFYSAVYKAFKPFSFAWQNIIQDSWQAHCGAFQRISIEGFKNDLSGILACSKLLSSLKMSSKWKESLSREKFLLMVLDHYKDCPMTVIQGTNQTCFVLHPHAKLPHDTSSSVCEKALSQPVLLSTVVPEKSILLVTPPEEKTGHVDAECSVSSSAYNEKQPSLGTEIIASKQPISTASAVPMTTERLTSDGSIESEVKTDIQRENMISQAQDIFEFYHSMEPASTQPKAPKQKLHKEKKTPNKKSPKEVKPHPAKKIETIKVEKERIVLTIGRKKTPEAIADFLKAFDLISPFVKKSLHPSVSKAILELKSSHKLKLSKAYKLMLAIIPHVGKFEIYRGKGSHALITLYVNGLQKM